MQHDPLPTTVRVGARNRREQRARVWVLWRAVDVVGRRYFHDAAEVHDRDAVRDVLHHREIVGDEKVAEFQLALQVEKQVQHLALDRDVERRHRLVADQEARVERERTRNADALALAAGEFKRVTIRRGGRQADLVQQGQHLTTACGAITQRMDIEWLADNLADGVPGVQRLDRILKHHLQMAPVGLERTGSERGEIRAFENNLASGRLVEPHDAFPERRLAATRLADEPQRLAGLQRERDTVDCLERATRAQEQSGAHGKMHAHVAQFEQGSGWSDEVHGGVQRGGSSRQRWQAVS